MFVRMALTYNRHISYTMRRVIEFVALLNAIFLFILLIYIHFIFNRYPSSCLDIIKESWPRKGVLRVEVIQNFDEFMTAKAKFLEIQNALQSKNHVTEFNLKNVLIHGPAALPSELKSTLRSLVGDGQIRAKGLENITLRMENISFQEPAYVYVIEYSLHYDLLRLSPDLRRNLGVPAMLVQLDASQECLGDWQKMSFLMRHLIGFGVMSAVRSLAKNETKKGYLRDMISGEYYHFASEDISKVGIITAALLVMLVYTFNISLLLRFLVHQISIIVNMFQMLEMDQLLIFSLAPFQTAILALADIRADMFRIFSDAFIVFFVILIVWMADQYDANCCHSSIGKRYWLRFFYLYHFAFYAYQYRYNGQFSGLALLTSASFILHSMIFFFHHYELPFLIYEERLRIIINIHDDLHSRNTVVSSTTLNYLVMRQESI